jgi:hypothetical protein
MKRKTIFGLLIAILASGLLIAGCDIFPENFGGPSAYEPLIIRGKTINGDDVEVEISTKRTPRVVLTPENGDNYVLRINGVEVSRGTIQLDETRMTFYPSNGQPFVADYTKGDDYIFMYEIPDVDGGLTTGLGDSNPGRGGDTNTAAAAAKSLATMINGLSQGGATVSGTTVTLTDNTVLEGDLEIPRGVTVKVPDGIKLTVSGPALEGPGYADPDDPVGDGVNTIAGSGSWQIIGDGTLDVYGNIVVRNRTLRAKTIIHSGAGSGYTIKNWVGSGGTDGDGFSSANLTSILSLDTASTLEITYEKLPPPAAGSLVYDAYTFTLKGGAATLNSTFGLGAQQNNLRDTVVIASDATLNANNSNSEIIGDGTIEVYGIINLVLSAIPAPPSDATLIFYKGSQLNSYPLAGNSFFKTIGEDSEYEYRVRDDNASIEMNVAETSGGYPFTFTFKGGRIETRLAGDANSGRNAMYIQGPVTATAGGELYIPAGSNVAVVGPGGRFKDEAGIFKFGVLTIASGGKLSVEGNLAVDGNGSSNDYGIIKVQGTTAPSSTKIGYLNKTSPFSLTGDSANWESNGGFMVLKSKS